MGLPFTAEQFFGVCADYNRAFIVAVVALLVASIVLLAHVSRDPSRRTPRWSLFLAALWLASRTSREPLARMGVVKEGIPWR